MSKVLGIDCSNYKTSIAVVEDSKIIYDKRKFLPVKEGEKGLRQSDALFHHINQLPELINEVEYSDCEAVSVSTRPRPLEGSYMPCFKAGETIGIAIAKALNKPVYFFSHQEGHIKAVQEYSPLKDSDDFISFHISGGTLEVLHVKNSKIELIGNSLDISYGQVLDRLGVSLGMSFPCGEELDNIAFNSKLKPSSVLSKIKVHDRKLNLSGFDTQIDRAEKNEELILEVFQKIALSLVELSKKSVEFTGCKDILYSGGVASSKTIKRILEDSFKESNINPYFGEAFLASDNAIGIALLGGEKYGNETR